MTQEMVEFWDGRGISWTTRKQSAPRCRQITTPAPSHSIFTGRMLLVTPNQQCQSTEGREAGTNNSLHQESVRQLYTQKDRHTDRWGRRNYVFHLSVRLRVRAYVWACRRRHSPTKSDRLAVNFSLSSIHCFWLWTSVVHLVNYRMLLSSTLLCCQLPNTFEFASSWWNRSADCFSFQAPIGRYCWLHLGWRHSMAREYAEAIFSQTVWTLRYQFVPTACTNIHS